MSAVVTPSSPSSPSEGVITEEVHVSYDPATNSSTVDDRRTARGGARRGRVGVHREPYGQDGAKTTARLYSATVRAVRFDVAGYQVDLNPTGR